MYKGYKLSWNFQGINDSKIQYNENDLKSKTESNYIKNIEQSVLYPSIFEGVDLEYIINGEGIKENFILNQYIKDFSVTLAITMNNLTLSHKDDGVVQFLDEDGEIIFQFGNLVMYDSNGNRSEEVNINIKQLKKNEYRLTLTPNEEWLKSDDRKYPIVVDPSVRVTNTETHQYIQDKAVSLNSSYIDYGDTLYVGKIDTIDYTEVI